MNVNEEKIKTEEGRKEGRKEARGRGRREKEEAAKTCECGTLRIHIGF